jgi:hypothetical protein
LISSRLLTSWHHRLWQAASTAAQHRRPARQAQLPLIKGKSLISSMGPPPTQAVDPHDRRSTPTTSTDGSGSYHIRFLRLQPTGAP